jgi:hypothetical protein
MTDERTMKTDRLASSDAAAPTAAIKEASTPEVANTPTTSDTTPPQAPVSAICEGASAHAAAQIDDDSEIKPVEGFFLTSQRWH